MKFCTRCKQIKEDSEFYTRKIDQAKQTWCQSCMVDYNRLWYKANREKHIAYVSEHRPPIKHCCKGCGQKEPEVRFAVRKVGNNFYRRFLCYTCDVEHRKKYPTTALAKQRELDRRKAVDRLRRQSPGQAVHVYTLRLPQVR